MDFDRILPQLFVGSYPRDAGDIETLRREGITAVLNLQTDEDMQYFRLDWTSLKASYEACRIEIRRRPVRDFDPDDLLDKLPECVAILNGLLEAGQRVYLHCSAGAGRSPSVAIAYLGWCGGRPLDEAIALVESRRRCSPDEEVIRAATLRLKKGPGSQPC